MTNEAPVDIIMGAYNGAEFIQEQVDSLFAQTHSNWRLLVRDDGSADETVKLLKDMSKTDPRVKLVSDDLGNLGVNRNFHHLLDLSSAPYVMFCDQDDVWLPRKIELTLSTMLIVEQQNRGRPTLVHCDAMVTDRNLATMAERFIGTKGRRTGLFAFLFSNCVQGAATMINAPLRERVLRMQPLLPYDYHCGLIAEALGRRLFIDQALLLYRQHDRNDIGASGVEPSFAGQMAWQLQMVFYLFFTGARVGHKPSASNEVAEILQLKIDSFPRVEKTVRFFEAELLPQVKKEIDDFSHLLSSKSILERLLIGLRIGYRRLVHSN